MTVWEIYRELVNNEVLRKIFKGYLQLPKEQQDAIMAAIMENYKQEGVR